MKKCIKNLTLAASIATSSFMPSAQAHPLETLMPFVTRILWHSKNVFNHNALALLRLPKIEEPLKLGDTIKMLAQRNYGIACDYPVYVVNWAEKPSVAWADCDTNETGKKPKIDSKGSVIIDINDRELFTTENPCVFFDRAFVYKQACAKNHPLLTAVLNHEVGHLQTDDERKRKTLQTQLRYAHQNKLPAILNGRVMTHLSNDHEPMRMALSRLQEQAADFTNKHPDLCRALSSYFLQEARSKDIKKLSTVSFFHEKETIIPPCAETLALYEKVCNDHDPNASELLECIPRLTHPLAIRRVQYLAERARDAQAGKLTPSPNISKAFKDYCERLLLTDAKI